MVEGRAVVGVDTGMELGTLAEQVQVVELSGGEWRGALLSLCTSVCRLLLCESGWAVTGDLMDEVAV